MYNNNKIISASMPSLSRVCVCVCVGGGGGGGGTCAFLMFHLSILKESRRSSQKSEVCFSQVNPVSRLVGTILGDF